MDRRNPTRNTDGSPTLDNPTVSLAEPGPARIGVPNFFIEKFRIPPFLLPIYQAAGIEYGVRWEVLAAINEIETDYGRNLNVSSAGALGWMQFMPSTWDAYGVDGNQDGLKDPYNPVDAIFAAARYLRAAGADTDLRTAIFAYNHADWYVDSVILRARYIGGLPADLVGSLSGLTQGRFPVQAKATYAKEVRRKDLETGAGQNPAYVVESSSNRKGIKIFAKAGRAGRRRQRRPHRPHRPQPPARQLRDAPGRLRQHVHLRPPQVGRGALPDAQAAARRPQGGRARAAAAVARRRPAQARLGDDRGRGEGAPQGTGGEGADVEGAPRDRRQRGRQGAPVRQPGPPERGGRRRRGAGRRALRGLRLLPEPRLRPRPRRRGDEAAEARRAGHVGHGPGPRRPHLRRNAPHLLFEIRPAGRGAPRIDPKPILDGWKLLESTAIYRAAGRNPFVGKDAQTPSIGQILLMSKESLAQRVLADPNVQVYGCGRTDIRSGQIDRRVLATLEFLVASGLKPTVTSLRCGHSYLTASGNVSEHSTGTAVDIAAINGVPIVGHQGAGSIAELTVQRLLTLQGTMKPHQIISLMRFPGTDNTLAMADHDDHIHVGFRPLYGANEDTAKQVDAILKPEQWIKLIERLDEIDNPKVPRSPSKYAVKTGKRASPAHKGE